MLKTSSDHDIQVCCWVNQIIVAVQIMYVARTTDTTTVSTRSTHRQTYSNEVQGSHYNYIF